MSLGKELTGPIAQDLKPREAKAVAARNAILDLAEVPSPLELMHLLWRRKWLLATTVFGGCLLGFAVAKLQQPYYEATVGIEMVGLNENFLGAKTVSAVEQQTASAEASDLQTQLRLLQSNSLLLQVLLRCAAVPSGCQATGKPFFTNDKGADASPTVQRELETIAKHLDMRIVPLTRVIEINFTAPDPRVAADFANTLSDEFIKESVDARKSVNLNTKQWLTSEVDTLRGKLEKSEDQLQQYARNAHLLLLSEKGDIAEDKLRQLQQDLSAAHSDRIAKQSRQETAAINPNGTPELLNDIGLKTHETTLTQLKTQAANLDLTFTPEHYRVQRLRAEIKTVEEEIARQKAALLRGVQNAYQEAVRREDLLTASYASQLRLVALDSERAVQYNILKREVDSTRQLYDAMLQHLKEATLATAIIPSNLRVIDSAFPARRPVRPNLRLFVLVGAFTGLLAGIAYVIIRRHADRTVQERGEVSLYLNLPELGVIPSANFLQPTPFRDILPFPRSGHRALGLSIVAGNLNQTNYGERRSAFADSFRSTLISLVFAKTQSGGSSTIVITSAGKGEGKSTVACNLALASAELGHRVLLIDADLRRPTLHTYFNLPSDKGLADVLCSTGESASSARACLRETNVANLSVLPSGKTEGIGTNLLYGKQMQSLVESLRDDFDLIFIDSGPVLQVPDARVLGRLADGVIVVVRANTTTRDMAFAACQRLSEDGVTILGTVLNDWSPGSIVPSYYGAIEKTSKAS